MLFLSLPLGKSTIRPVLVRGIHPRTVEKAMVPLSLTKRFKIVNNANFFFFFFFSSNSNNFFNWKLKKQAGFEISTNHA